jgi:hypothetical protein
MQFSVGSNSRASSAKLRPARASSTIRRRYSGGYGGRLFDIVDSSLRWAYRPSGQASTKPGQLQKAQEALADAERGADQASRSLPALLPILGSTTMKLSGLVRVRRVDLAEENVLGLRLPTLRTVEFDEAE